MRTNLFFLIMAASSGVTLLRGFVVAGILAAVEFGTYATAIGVGAFASIVISFGSVEATWKQFPRFWAKGQFAQIVDHSRKVDRTLLLRIAVLTGVAAFVLYGRADVSLVLIVGAFAFSVASVASGSSFLRASGDPRTLAWGTLLRASVAFLGAIGGAWAFSWPGAVLGEVLGAICFLVYVEIWRRRTAARTGAASKPSGSDAPETSLAKEASGKGGLLLYLSGLMVAVPIYLDRLFVQYAVGSEAAGTYSFMMLFNVAAVTVVGIVVQKAGPQIVRLGQSSGGDPAATRGFAWLWVVGIIGLVALGMACCAALLLLGPAGPLAEKYSLNLTLLLALSALCMTQAFVLFDWVLMEHDREADVFRNACVLLSAVVLSALAVWSFGAPILWVVILLACSKLVQIGFQLQAVYRLPIRKAAV